MRTLIALALLVAAASASVYIGRIYYGGLYPGYCPLDGYYYYNAKSFVQCDNGKHTVRPCAPGTKNGAVASYKAGSYYKTSVFCNEIVDAEAVVEEKTPAAEEKADEGYAAPAAHGYGPGYGYGYPGPYGYFPYGAYPGYGYPYAAPYLY